MTKQAERGNPNTAMSRGNDEITTDSMITRSSEWKKRLKSLGCFFPRTIRKWQYFGFVFFSLCYIFSTTERQSAFWKEPIRHASNDENIIKNNNGDIQDGSSQTKNQFVSKAAKHLHIPVLSQTTTTNMTKEQPQTQILSHDLEARPQNQKEKEQVDDHGEEEQERLQNTNKYQNKPQQEIPHLLLAGVPKAGTTAITNYLRTQYPDLICLAKPQLGKPLYSSKETQFFYDPQLFQEGISFFKDLYQHCNNHDYQEEEEEEEEGGKKNDTNYNNKNRILMEATPGHFLFPKQILDFYETHGVVKDLRIVIIVREPMSRELSWYQHQVFVVERALQKAVRSHPQQNGNQNRSQKPIIPSKQQIEIPEYSQHILRTDWYEKLFPRLQEWRQQQQGKKKQNEEMQQQSKQRKLPRNWKQQGHQNKRRTKPANFNNQSQSNRSPGRHEHRMIATTDSVYNFTEYWKRNVQPNFAGGSENKENTSFYIWWIQQWYHYLQKSRMNDHEDDQQPQQQQPPQLWIVNYDELKQNSTQFLHKLASFAQLPSPSSSTAAVSLSPSNKTITDGRNTSNMEPSFSRPHQSVVAPSNVKPIDDAFLPSCSIQESIFNFFEPYNQELYQLLDGEDNKSESSSEASSNFVMVEKPFPRFRFHCKQSHREKGESSPSTPKQNQRSKSQ